MSVVRVPAITPAATAPSGAPPGMTAINPTEGDRRRIKPDHSRAERDCPVMDSMIARLDPTSMQRRSSSRYAPTCSWLWGSRR